MLKVNGNKGITLIALIITVIVLLILAGVTINAISGSESAPAKANEAGQKNDIGAAKDDISLAVVNAKMQGMENAYVENGVSASEAQNTVGRTVIQAVDDKYATNNQIGNATIDIDVPKTNNVISDNATISVTTTDYAIEGTITLKDGVLTWGEIEPNVPRISGMPETLSLDTGSNYTINAKLKGITGDISWSSNKPTIASVSNGTITTALSITNPTEQVTITASADGCESKSCILTVTKAMPYAKDVLVLTNNVSPYVDYTDKNGNTIHCRVLYNDVNDVNGTHGLQIISANSVVDVGLGTADENYKDDSTLTELQKAQLSYNNVIENLNNKAENYNNANLSYDARCLGSVATVTNNAFANKDDETEIQANGHKGSDINFEEDFNKIKTLGIRNISKKYWLASRYVNGNGFDVYYVNDYGNYDYKSLFALSGAYYARSYGFRPVFLLKSNVKISGGQGTSTSPYELFAE